MISPHKMWGTKAPRDILSDLQSWFIPDQTAHLRSSHVLQGCSCTDYLLTKGSRRIASNEDSKSSLCYYSWTLGPFEFSEEIFRLGRVDASQYLVPSRASEAQRTRDEICEYMY